MLRSLLQYALTQAGMQEVVLYARVSPRYSDTRFIAAEPVFSIECQVEALKRVCPIGFPITMLKNEFVSAYTVSDEQRLPLLPYLQGRRKVCVFAVTLDRIVQRTESLSHLQQSLHESGNIGISFSLGSPHMRSLHEGLSPTIRFDIL